MNFNRTKNYMMLGKIFKRHCEALSSSTVEINDTIEASKLEHHKLHCLHMSYESSV